MSTPEPASVVAARQLAEEATGGSVRRAGKRAGLWPIRPLPAPNPARMTAE